MKATLEYEDSEELGLLFQHAIVHCHEKRISLMSEIRRGYDSLCQEEIDMNNRLIEYYREQAETYEKMRDALSWD